MCHYEQKWLMIHQINEKKTANNPTESCRQTKSEEIAFGELWLARAGVLWCFFFCRMQFKHTLGLQDFMNRTENQEQSRAERRKGSERGKRGNEIVARERKGDGGEKRREREDDLRGRPKWKKGEKGTERGSKTSQRMSNGLLKMHCWNACWSIPCQHKIPITHSPLLGSSWAKGRPVSVNPDKEIIKKKMLVSLQNEIISRSILILK